jgi:hypothetical protein
MKKIVLVLLSSFISLAVSTYTCKGQSPVKDADIIQKKNDSVSGNVKKSKPSASGQVNMAKTKKAPTAQSAWSISRIGDTSKNKINRGDHH